MTYRSRCALAALLSLLPVAASGAAAPEAMTASATAIDRAATLARALPAGAQLRLDGMVLAPGGLPETLELRRFQVFTPDARLVVHGEDGGEETLVPPGHAWFRGHVAGDPSSRVVLTFPAEGPVRGLVARGDRLWSLGEESRGRRAGALTAQAVAADEAAEDFTCGNDDLPPVPAPDGGLFGAEPAPLPDLAATTTPYTARVAVETDYELYLRLGSEQAVVDYVGDLFAYASTIYDDEVNTDLQVSHLSTWTTPQDPWTQISSSCAMYEFGRYWNDNRTGVSRTIAHFVSGKSTGGGVAWVGVLCNGGFNVNLGTSCPGLQPSIDTYGGAYGFTGAVTGSFNPDLPLPVWDIVATSHEIGHNFNSPHTHCYNGIGGSSEPVDRCYNGQAGNGCYSGSTSLPCGTSGAGCGTLMSYCHQLSGGLSNISLTFGTAHPYGVLPDRVPNRMRAHVEAVAGSNPVCLARVAACTDDLELTATTVSTTELYETCGTLRAHGGFEIVSPADVTLQAGVRVILGEGFSVEQGAQLRVRVQ